jgi:hypothetical protein
MERHCDDNYLTMTDCDHHGETLSFSFSLEILQFHRHLYNNTYCILIKNSKGHSTNIFREQ